MLIVVKPEEAAENLKRELGALKIGDHINFYCKSSGIIPRDALIVLIGASGLSVIELSLENRNMLLAGESPMITEIAMTDLSTINNETRRRERAERHWNFAR